MQHDVIIERDGVNPKSMVSKVQEYGLPEPGRRSPARLYPRTISHDVRAGADLLRYELVAQSHRRSSKIPRRPPHLLTSHLRLLAISSASSTSMRGTGPSTQFYCPRQ